MSKWWHFLDGDIFLFTVSPPPELLAPSIRLFNHQKLFSHSLLRYSADSSSLFTAGAAVRRSPASAFHRKLNFWTRSCRSLRSGSLSIPSHADITLSLYLLTSAPPRHATGQEPAPGSADELVCCVFVCTQLGGGGGGNQVQEGGWWWRVYNVVGEEVEGTYPELRAVCAQVFLHPASVLKLETVCPLHFFCNGFFILRHNYVLLQTGSGARSFVHHSKHLAYFTNSY